MAKVHRDYEVVQLVLELLFFQQDNMHLQGYQCIPENIDNWLDDLSHDTPH